jgi:hypothetical protein
VRFERNCHQSIFGESAFSNCLSLRSICIPHLLKRFPTTALHCFGYCEKLAFEGLRESLRFESGSKVFSVGQSAFGRCSSLRSICLPCSIHIMGDYCFVDCARLSDLTLDSGCKLSSPSECKFHYCSSLRSISIPSSIETISFLPRASGLPITRFADDLQMID